MPNVREAKQGEPPILIEHLENDVLWLTLNRPEVLNAIDRDLGLRLLETIRRAGADTAVRAIVLTGAGRGFCAGDDIAGLKGFLEGDFDHPKAAVDPVDRSSLYLLITAAMKAAPKPVIAAINGATFGAGCELACAADIRCMSRSARIGSGLVNIGQLGTAAYLPQVIGSARAFEIYATGRSVDAEEALSIGLVTQVFEDEDLLSSVGALATKLAAGPTRVLGLQKGLLDACESRPLMERVALQERAHQVCFFETMDAKEGARAFIGKRPPLFRGD
ncbi:enoyl-CoA hydratase-related protein [Brevundimonas diminuta]|uniref:enoyl-CoA hydratase/isomerase family protein n=1 Tax=Brevundimonas diminuta TaxID=293 RepID=UPI0032084739